MVSKLQKKQQKAKVREKENNKKIREKREKMREPKRQEAKERKLNKRIGKLQTDMAGLEQWEEETLKKLPESAFAQLEHNAKILRVLESEHEAELAKKRELHEGLEEQGHITLEDKMDAMLASESQMDEMGVGGNAECKVVAAPKPKRRKKQVAIVEVIKAPSNEEDENS